MNSEPDDLISKWHDKTRQDMFSRNPGVEMNFLEIGNLPRNCSSRSILSLLVNQIKITPRRGDICTKSDTNVSSKQVAVIEYRSQRDAHTAAERIRKSSFGKEWDVKIMSNPNRSNNEKDMMASWLE